GDSDFGNYIYGLANAPYPGPATYIFASDWASYSNYDPSDPWWYSYDYLRFAVDQGTANFHVTCTHSTFAALGDSYSATHDRPLTKDATQGLLKNDLMQRGYGASLLSDALHGT